MGRRAKWCVIGILSAAVLAVAGWGVRTQARSTPSLSPSAISQALQPRLATGQVEHDFGFLDPTEECEHAFVISNIGDVPLTLHKVGTSCKCTVVDMPADGVPPGGRVTIRLASKIRQKEGLFHHSATFQSNDPSHPQVVLSMRGNIRILTACEPVSLVLDKTANQATRGRSLVYSQVYKAFKVKGATLSSPDIEWEVQNADAKALEAVHARHGVWVDVKAPPKLSSRTFYESLLLEIQPDEPGVPSRQVKLDVRNEVDAAVSLYGDRIVLGEFLRIGVLTQGQGNVQHLVLKVRDTHRELNIGEIDTVPDFLRVRVEPYSEESKKKGLYRVDVEIPADAPACGFMGVRRGEFRIHTDHPRVPVVKLPVEFAVLPSEDAVR